MHPYTLSCRTSQTHKPKLIKEYGYPSADRKESTGIQQSVIRNAGKSGKFEHMYN